MPIDLSEALLSVVLGLGLAALGLSLLWGLDGGRLRWARFEAAPPTEPALWTGVDVIVALVGHMGLLIFCGVLAFQLSGGAEAELRARAVAQLVAVLGAGGGGVLYPLLIVRRVLGQPFAALGLRGGSWRNLAPTLLAVPLAYPSLLVIAVLWRAVLVRSGVGTVAEQGTVTLFAQAVGDGDALAIAALAAAAIGVAPVVEEVLFRGFVYGGLRRRWGAAGAAVLTSLVFALWHANLYAAVPLFGVGLLLIWVRERTGGLLFPILFHAAFNALGVVGIWWEAAS